MVQKVTVVGWLTVALVSVAIATKNILMGHHVERPHFEIDTNRT